MTEADLDNQGAYQVCVVKSDPHEIQIPKDAIALELERCGFGKEAIFAIKLSLEEALTNALRHGNCSDPSKKITVRYAIDDKRAVILVRDEGSGFIPEDIPDPTSPDRLPIPSGRGIMLMRTYMDEVEYRDRGREVYFMKRRT